MLKIRQVNEQQINAALNDIDKSISTIRTEAEAVKKNVAEESENTQKVIEGLSEKVDQKLTDLDSAIGDNIEYLNENFVPNTRTINDKPLSDDIVLTASDVGAATVNDITNAINDLDVASAGGAGKYISEISESNGKISATATTMDTTPTANSTNAVTSGGIKSAIDTAETNAKNLANATGTLPVANGGTGATTGGGACTNLIGALSVATGDVTDNTDVITSNADGYAEQSDKQFYKRKGIKFWNYIKSKISSVLKISLNKHTIQGSTVGTNTFADTNPKLVFNNVDGSQAVSLTFTDYDSVQAPASLTLNGNQGGEYFIAPNIKATNSFVANPTARNSGLQGVWNVDQFSVPNGSATQNYWIMFLGKIPTPDSTTTNFGNGWDEEGWLQFIRYQGHNDITVHYKAGCGYSWGYGVYGSLDFTASMGDSVELITFTYNGVYYLGIQFYSVQVNFSVARARLVRTLGQANVDSNYGNIILWKSGGTVKDSKVANVAVLPDAKRPRLNVLYPINAIKGVTGNINGNATTATSASFATQSDYTRGTALCTTAGGTAAKVASMRGFALPSPVATTLCFPITFTETNAAASELTLNINGTGAKKIYINGAVSSSSNYVIPAGTYLCEFYNDVYYIEKTWCVYEARNCYSVNSFRAMGWLNGLSDTTYKIEPVIGSQQNSSTAAWAGWRHFYGGLKIAWGHYRTSDSNPVTLPVTYTSKETYSVAVTFVLDSNGKPNYEEFLKPYSTTQIKHTGGNYEQYWITIGY